VLPAGLTFVSANPGTAYTSATGVWSVGTLANGASTTLVLVATASGAVGTAVTNTASVSRSDQSDPNTGNNSASVVVTPRAGTTLTFIPAPASPFAVGALPTSIVVGDFNGDGKPDLAITNEFGNSVSVLLGTGNGGFTPAPGSPIAAGNGRSPDGITVGDFNGDGKLDIAFANEDNTVSVLLGTGNGGFTNVPGSPFTVGGGTTGVAVGDFNGDGKPDLAVTNATSNNVSVLLGTGNGSFTNAPGSPFAVGLTPVRIAVGDFNGDSKLDLVVGNANGNSVSVLLGTGNGSFINAPGSPFAASNPDGIAVADFNGDGKLDLVVANAVANNTVSVLLGNGNGTFTAAPGSPFAVGGNPQGVAAADFNGDGKPDIAVLNGDDSTVSVLLQQ